MRFTWDERKNQRNRSKHGVRFESAQLVFSDPLHLIAPDDYSRTEERWHVIGMAMNTALLFVVYMVEYLEDGEEAIHIISARNTTKHERRIYETKQR